MKFEISWRELSVKKILTGMKLGAGRSYLPGKKQRSAQYLFDPSKKTENESDLKNH